MSMAGTGRRKNRSTSALDAAATAPDQTLGRGVGGAAAAAAAAGQSFGRGVHSAASARSLGRVVGLAPPPRSSGRGGGSAASPSTLPATAPFSIDRNCGGGFPSMSSASMGFQFPPSPSAGAIDGFSFPAEPSPALFGAAGGDSSSPGSWDNNLHPSGGFSAYFSNQPHYENENDNVEVFLGNPSDENENVRTEKRIMWTPDEDFRVMSAWLKHSTDSTCGADKGGGQYWGEVVETYNKTTPSLRRRNAKQCKDRWHKINKWIDLFECAYVKARRVFTSGYSDQMWLDAAHKFYVEDNKKLCLGPFVLMEVWKICRLETKWKTYNENLKNARKRKTYNLEGDSEGDDDTFDKMPKRPMGQKAAKKAARAANNKSKGRSSSDDGSSKESPIELDKFEIYTKFQEANNDKRMKLLDRQEKISTEKLEATRIANLTAQEYKEGRKLEKETKMLETYQNLVTQDTSLMTDEEKAQRVHMMKCLMKALFPENN